MNKIIVLMDKQDYRSLENTMRMQIEDENGTVLHKMTEAKTKQQWYREVFREGIRAKLQRFEKKRKEIEEDADDTD